ncbi:MAG: tRNA (adenosine(37)-N6)-threonylcarbamoyltransferase complex transferase subunit TsaD, partial [Clostridia bacterium]|nr:tRNA (adenosine(37)-N6)-threonylcarbamoyltransferase complex transferase subunit TsaD [Clostridia bacterium]
MKIIGFESSCDETAVAIADVDENGTIVPLASCVNSQIPLHRLYGGVVPEIAGRAHIEAISPLTEEAFKEAGLTPADIDAVAVTANPGLIGALLVGVNFAKAFAFAQNVPLVAVDHMKAHIAAAYVKFEGKEAPKPPFIALAVSGGHTSLYLVSSYTDYKEIGATRDDAIGEAFDKVGRLLCLSYPAGADFDKLAQKGFALACGKED